MNHTDQWSKYRRMHWMASIGLVAGLPTILVINITLKAFGMPHSTALFSALAAIWAVLWGWSAFRVVRFPCPRCGMAFLSNQELQFETKRCCAGCGLELYAQP